MNKKIITSLVCVLSLVATVPVYAETATRPTVEARMTAGKEKGTQAIDMRITRLNQLLDRVNGMKRVTSAGKTSITGSIQTIINELNTLKTQIAGDTSTTTVKADVSSITKAYRVYALVIPQIQLIATVDRIITISDQLTTIRAKLADRLAQTTDVANLSELQAALSDMDGKLTDVKTQVNIVMTNISPLVPDNGDKTVFEANTKALRDAHAKVKLAEADLRAARQDAQKVISALKGKMRKATTTPAQ